MWTVDPGDTHIGVLLSRVPRLGRYKNVGQRGLGEDQNILRKQLCIFSEGPDIGMLRIFTCDINTYIVAQQQKKKFKLLTCVTS